ncbi:YceI family protein [Candidatus Uhrbacteria bacterium]|jgi:polyisoprenoid-binding protein YceI|nr:YceI family protein [Candidatus Uhrbacteria bacterium]
MKKLSMLFLTLALVGAGCSQTAEPVAEVEIIPEEGEVMADVLEDGEYSIDSSVSKVAWVAEKITKQGHNGEIVMSEGGLVITEGEVVSGSVTMDMTTITSLDLPEDKSGGLITHLESEDFFFVEEYPTSKFVFTSLETAEDGSQTVKGDLTMREITRGVSFPVIIEHDENSVHLTGDTTIDRTNWGVNAQSGKIFASLGDSAIKDDVELTLDVTWIK